MDMEQIKRYANQSSNYFVSDSVLIDRKSFLSKPGFPLFILFLVKGLKPGGSSNKKLLLSKLELILSSFLSIKQSFGPFILGLSLEPVGIPRNPLDFLSILFSILVLLVYFNPFFYDVHYCITYSL